MLSLVTMREPELPHDHRAETRWPVALPPNFCMITTMVDMITARHGLT
jgi:hypothetical protein